MIAQRFTTTEHGVIVTNYQRPIDHHRAPTHNEVMRLGGGSTTAVLESLGIQPGDPNFEEMRNRFIEGCRNAKVSVVEQAGIIPPVIIEPTAN